MKTELIAEWFFMSRAEVASLSNFLYSVGYISHEKHMPIHNLIKRIGDFLDE